MEKRFIIPALCALLLHAALLFGSRPAVSKGAALDKDDGVIACGDPLTPPERELLETFLVNRVEEEAVTEDSLGTTDSTNPTLPDNSDIAKEADDFIVINRPVVNVTRGETDRINPAPIGSPTGNPDVFERGVVLFDSRSLDRVPRALAQIPPRYPAEARMKGLSGEVVVEFAVDESGSVSSCRVVRSTNREFEAAALAAVRKWRFEPGRRHGRIVRFSMVVPVVFRLNE